MVACQTANGIALTPHMQIVWTVMETVTTLMAESTPVESDHKTLAACATLLCKDRLNEWDFEAWALVWRYYADTYQLVWATPNNA